MDIEEALKNPAFKDLEPERKEAFRELSKKLEGKSKLEAFSVIIEFSKNMPKGRDIPKDEQQLMLSAFMDSMPPEERKKYEAILKLVPNA